MTAYDILDQFEGPEIPIESVLAALDALTSPLKGVGPATASLVLSVMKPAIVPFFSDELYIWTHQVLSERSETDVVTADKEAKKTRIATTKLQYSRKEYATLYENVCRILTELNAASIKDDGLRLTAIELEKAAYVFVREQGIAETKSSSSGAPPEKNGSGSTRRSPSKRQTKRKRVELDD